MFMGFDLRLFKWIGGLMNNLKFTAMVGAVAAATLGMASHHQSPVPAIPVVIVYHDSSLQAGQTSPSGDTFWTFAVRSDGANMQANSVPDATGHIEGVKSLQFQDRYVVVDSPTTSVITYKPYRPMIAGGQSCAGKSDGSILNHAVDYVQITKPATSLHKPTERWMATDLNCLLLREHFTITEKDGKEVQLFREAVSIKPGEPPAAYFEIPTNYVERGPADVDGEVQKLFPGKHVISNPEILNKLQHVYETDKLSK
jgi:hypothetical protein